MAKQTPAELLASAPPWLLEAIACPVCKRGCVQSPSRFMTCGAVPAHTGLIMRHDASTKIAAAFALFAGGLDKKKKKDRAKFKGIFSSTKAVNVAWRIMRLRFKTEVAHTFQIGS